MSPKYEGVGTALCNKLFLTNNLKLTLNFATRTEGQVAHAKMSLAGLFIVYFV